MHTYSAQGSSMLINCTCNKGYTGSDGVACLACRTGTFKEVNGSAPCSLCRGGTFSGDLAQLSVAVCRECPLHTHSREGSSEVDECVCNAGYTGVDGADCSACLAGTYKSGNGSAPCSDCAQGKYSNVTAATSDATCVACPPHSYAVQGSRNITDCVCNGGYTGPDGGPCLACRAGSFKKMLGSGPCEACFPGKFSAKMGGTNCSSCPPFSYSGARSVNASNCTCNMGYAGFDSCIPCGAGKYSAKNGSCTQCPPGTYSGEAAANCSLCPNETRVSDNRSACVASEGDAAVLQAQALSATLSAVVGAVVGAAVGGAVAGGAGGGGGGGGGGGAAQLVEQTQFMTIVGSVGGASASAGNKAFSDGYVLSACTQPRCSHARYTMRVCSAEQENSITERRVKNWIVRQVSMGKLRPDAVWWGKC